MPTCGPSKRPILAPFVLRSWSRPLPAATPTTPTTPPALSSATGRGWRPRSRRTPRRSASSPTAGRAAAAAGSELSQWAPDSEDRRRRRCERPPPFGRPGCGGGVAAGRQRRPLLSGYPEAAGPSGFSPQVSPFCWRFPGGQEAFISS